MMIILFLYFGLSVLINEEMLIKKETVARIFPIIQGKRDIDKSCLIYDCGCALTAISSL
jgi:hypothetical protein